jgi:cytochrome c peroxidase
LGPLRAVSAAALLCLSAFPTDAIAQQAAPAPPPRSLKDVAIPEPPNLHAFLKGTRGQADGNAARLAALQLGKALFWDMQVGSDNVQACASCHFNAGVDSRSKNQLDPGTADAGDTLFGNSKIRGVPGPNDSPWKFGFGPNVLLMPKHFPTHRRANPHQPGDGMAVVGVTLDTNDIVSSQGVKLAAAPGSGALDPRDDTFNYRDQNVRRSAPRNAPAAINGALHVDLFWDGRGSMIFNGQTPFGFRDMASKVKRVVNGVTQDVFVRIPYSAYASQAVGPPLSTREMSGHQRNFGELANKLLAPSTTPLNLQKVSTTDSVLGPLSRGALPGINTTYETLVRRAFREEWTGPVGSPSVMVHNFPLYFGLALQLYQSTLIADHTPYDQFVGANAAVREGGRAIPANNHALTAEEQRGLALFTAAGKCANCHALPETTNHTHRFAGYELRKGRNDKILGRVNTPADPVNEVAPQRLLELMPTGNGQMGVYDVGFYNIGVRPTSEDIGRGNSAPTGLLSTPNLPLSYARLALLKNQGQLPAGVANFVPDTGVDVLGNVLPLSKLFAAANNRVVDQGSFKTPILRNTEHQGPYFRTGSEATLRHVVEFYSRGGNFPATNAANLDLEIGYIAELDASLGRQQEADVKALVAFLSRGLSDDRVTYRRAPFDHPQIFLPIGESPSTTQPEQFIEIPETGAAGSKTPINRFLSLDPQSR